MKTTMPVIIDRASEWAAALKEFDRDQHTKPEVASVRWCAERKTYVELTF